MSHCFTSLFTLSSRSAIGPLCLGDDRYFELSREGIPFLPVQCRIPTSHSSPLFPFSAAIAVRFGQ